MNSLRTLLNRCLTPCLHCGSFNKSDGLLCPPCRITVNSYLKPQLESLDWGVFEAYSLFKWTPGTSDLLSAQLVGLKGTQQNSDWNHWAGKFLIRRIQRGLPDRRIIVIPAPSSNPSRGKDHAYQWAEALSEALGAELYPCLNKKANLSQRGASRERRVQVELELDENSSLVSENWSEALWVFADDIVTTGSTVLAAYEALGRPPHFEAWTLAHRTLTCGD